MIKMLKDGTLILRPERLIEAEYIKVDAPERPPGSIVRRTDFAHYLHGHGTFYRFDKDHFPDYLLDAKRWETISLVLYNLHTDQLDEVVFTKESQYELGKYYIKIRGSINDVEDHFDIRFRYKLSNPLESEILVYACAPTDYNFQP